MAKKRPRIKKVVLVGTGDPKKAAILAACKREGIKLPEYSIKGWLSPTIKPINRLK